jgi:putative transposase
LGYGTNHKTVQKLMGQLGLKSIVRPKRYKSYRGAVGKVADNHLAREFRANAFGEKWVTDVTEFKVHGEKVYLSPMLDLYNGEVIAYQIQSRPTYDLVGKMLMKALKKLKPTQTPLVHSDQGWQYQMQAFQRELKAKGLEQSMSRKGNCLDNAVIESFFGVLKTEFFYGRQFESVTYFIRELKAYIQYYNHDRIKLKLNGLSPVQYRTQSLK